MNEIIEKLKTIDWLALGARLISAILIVIIGFWAVKMITRVVAKALNIKKFDNTLKGFILNLISSICKVSVILMALSATGMDMTVIGTIIAAGTLAILMSLQGSLSNIGGGVLIMILKPFKVGDFISAQGEAGVVKRIELFTTKLTTGDNKEVTIPNGVLSNGNITNFSAEDMRRVDLVFGVGYDSDIKQTKEVLMAVLKSYPNILMTNIPTVSVCELADSSVNFKTRLWVKTADYWDAYGYVLENAKIKLDEAGIDIPYPHSVEISKQG